MLRGGDSVLSFPLLIEPHFSLSALFTVLFMSLYFFFPLNKSYYFMKKIKETLITDLNVVLKFCSYVYVFIYDL